MDNADMVKRLQDFLGLYHPGLSEITPNKILVIDFKELSKFDPVVAEQLLDEPKEVIKAFEIVIEEKVSPLSLCPFDSFIGDKKDTNDTEDIRDIGDNIILSNPYENILFALYRLKEASIKQISILLKSTYGAVKKEIERKNYQYFSEIIPTKSRDIKGDKTKFWQLDEPGKQYVKRLIKLSKPTTQQITPIKKDFFINFKNLPVSSIIPISSIRSVHLNKLFQIKGLVKQQSDVRPQATNTIFECPSCGNIIRVLQLDKKFREPFRCSCGRKGKFSLVSKEFVDVRGLAVEEREYVTINSRKLNCLLKDYWASVDYEQITSPGKDIILTGILSEIPITLKNGSQSTKFDYCFDVHGIEAVMEQEKIQISSDDEKEINNFHKKHKDKTLQELANKILKCLYGTEKIKRGILLQIVGGRTKIKNKIRVRGNIHILLLGDPGTAKSQFLIWVSKSNPQNKYTANITSGCGLTASVVKDEFIGGWTLEAGAVVLSNKGICCIDELDKFDKKERNNLLEVLEQQTVTVSKANIHQTLQADTSCLFACNPINGRFKTNNPISETDLDNYFLDRMDLIYIIQDTLPREKIEAMLEEYDDFSSNDELFVLKYITYAKKFNPVLNKESKSFLADNLERKDDRKTRLVNSIQRLAEASAKIRLSNTVEVSDVKIAFELIGLSYEEKVQDNPVNFVRSKGKDGCPIEEFTQKYGEAVYDRLKNNKEIYEPESGVLRVLE